MRRSLAVAVAASLLVAGCSSTTSSEDFAREDAVDCRELGGGWVFIRYEQRGSSMQGVRLGVPTSDDGLLAEPNATDVEFEEAARQRAALGWDDDAVSQLQGPDVPGELTARLADMPSCLDQLAAATS
jgi:hypothetical protein